MKTILIAMALAIASASASAATCTTATINRDMVIHIQRGMTPEVVTGILGCMPTERPAPVVGSSRLLVWDTEDINPRKQIAVDFAVNYAGSSVLQAQYQEIPLSPGVGMSDGDTGGRDVAAAAAAALIALAAARGSFTGSAAASGCTPAQVNPGAVQRVRPYMSLGAAQAAVGCLPVQNTTTASGSTLMLFAIPLTLGGVYVVSDSRGVVSAVYIDPTVTSYTGVFAPNWIPSAGVISVPALR